MQCYETYEEVAKVRKGSCRLFQMSLFTRDGLQSFTAYQCNQRLIITGADQTQIEYAKCHSTCTSTDNLLFVQIYPLRTCSGAQLPGLKQSLPIKQT